MSISRRQFLRTSAAVGGSNNGDYMCQSTLLAILGRTAGYTGQEITWEQMKASKRDLSPERYAFDAPPPTLPGPDGRYPVATPGVTEFV